MSRLLIVFLVLGVAAAALAAGENAANNADDAKLLVQPDFFKTLVNPECSHCKDEAKRRAGELRDDDRVLGWTRGKYDGGAIPLRFFLAPYRVISDSYGVFVYDADAGYVRGYEPSYDFTFYGWRNGVMAIRHKDGTVYSALSGVAFDGPRKGGRLKPIATVQSDWGYWLKQYPGTVAYHMFDKYRPQELPKQQDAESIGTRPKPDPRLEANAEVIGLSLDGQARAYVIGAAGKSSVVADEMGNQDVVVLWYQPTHSGTAYAPEVEGSEPAQRVSLNVDETNPAAPYVDAKSGSHFGVEGRAVDGPLKGKTLRWLDSVQCRWFAWAGEYPRTSTYLEPSKPPAPLPDRQTLRTSGVIVDPDAVTPQRLSIWKSKGINAIAVVLDEHHPSEAYTSCAKAVSAASLALYYWIEVARNAEMADAHPRWMAALGMHEDWRRRFSDAPRPGKREVVKAYPWVPITYREAYDAHLSRLRDLLGNRATGPYAGVLLNDLQGGPSSCGCGNLQCRWATDYQVTSTATRLEGDDTAARFTADVRRLAPGKLVVPIWATECEDIDLPLQLAPGGKSTGLSGNVPCANGTCPKAFTKQWSALLSGYDGPVGVLALHRELERDAGWVPRTVAYLDNVPPKNGGRAVAHHRIWMVVQDDSPSGNAFATAQEDVDAVFRALVSLKQSFTPRVVSID